jgi:hypothetical protein
MTTEKINKEVKIFLSRGLTTKNNVEISGARNLDRTNHGIPGYTPWARKRVSDFCKRQG